jgi:hypothetical protein
MHGQGPKLKAEVSSALAKQENFFAVPSNGLKKLTGEEQFSDEGSKTIAFLFEPRACPPCSPPKFGVD